MVEPVRHSIAALLGIETDGLVVDEIQRNPYVIEVNSVPGMTELSLVPDAGRAMGVEFPELCERILEMAGFQK